MPGSSPCHRLSHLFRSPLFCRWMRQQRGTGDVTLRTYSIYIRELLQRFGEKSSRFDARRLRAFVLAKSRSCGWGAVKNCAKALRMFLRFLIAEGQCAVGLDAAIPTVAHWRWLLCHATFN